MSDQKVAIFFQLDPGQHLIGEGIGQYFARVIRGFVDNRRPVRIYVPIWARGTIENYLDWANLRSPLVEVAYTDPLGIRFFYRQGRKKKRGAPKELAERMRDFADVFGATFLILIGMLMAPLLLPIALAARFGRRALRKIARPVATRVVDILKTWTYAVQAKAIDDSKDVDCCIAPIGTWSMIRLVRKKPLAIQVPDVVFIEFPHLFTDEEEVQRVTADIRKTAHRATAVVSPSQYVRDRHIVGYLGIPATRAKVISHAPMTLDGVLPPALRGEKGPDKIAARKMLASFINSALDSAENMQRLDGSQSWSAFARLPIEADEEVIYYPTQNRPYKNIEGLIRAVDHLRSVHGRKVRVLLTGDLSSSPEIISYIRDAGLEPQITPLPRLPQDMHACAFAAADLGISASFFEGGFPFIFSEGMSLQRPVVMARIPVTTEMVKGPLTEIMLFDPESPADMARVIARALDDPKLYGRQMSLLSRMKTLRSWSDVAEDYRDAALGRFRDVASASNGSGPSYFPASEDEPPAGGRRSPA
jgi:glycosyltransferase involved in cell wall biosynthesis